METEDESKNPTCMLEIQPGDSPISVGRRPMGKMARFDLFWREVTNSRNARCRSTH